MQYRELEIEGFPGYAVSSDGFITNARTRRTLHRRLNQQGIAMSNMYDETHRLRTLSVAYVVAANFLGPHENRHYDTVMHLDGDRENCSVDNLVWRPRWFAIAFHKQFKNPTTPLRDRIICIDTDTIFETARDASIEYGMLEKDIIASAINHSYVWPNHYEFRIVRE